MELLGHNTMPEKLAALSVTNRAIKDYGINGWVGFSADDITALITTHIIKTTQQILVQAISLVTTKDAFRNAAEEYYLGNGRDNISIALASLKALHPSAPSTKRELHSLVLSAIDKVLVYHRILKK